MIIRLPIGMLESNTYLIYDDQSHLGAIVDPGGETERLFEEIRRRGVEIRYLLNTHAHFDHITANAQVLSKYEVPLALHPADRELLLRGGGAARWNIDYLPSPEPEIELTDGRRLLLGALEIESIHTPGHTPGSVCLYIPAADALITGDTLFPGSVGRTDLPGGDARQLTASLRRLLELPGETTLYPGHGPTTTLERERRTNPWLKRVAHS
ncbi:MAG: MBL fold metallo-hydrolase [Anaerolineales bacterium]